MQNTGLIEKIQNLPPETIVEIEHYVDFLAEKQKVKQRIRTDTKSIASNRKDCEKTGSVNLRERGINAEEAAAQRAAFAAFAEDWERPEMEIYDKL
jgi:hypothetical protein